MHSDVILVQQVSTARVYAEKRRDLGGALSQGIPWLKFRKSKLYAKTNWTPIKDITI